MASDMSDQGTDPKETPTGGDPGPERELTSREKVRAFVETGRVQNTIMALIIFNAITLGLSTSDNVQAYAGGLLGALDRIILAIFVAELVLKFYAYGRDFFRNPWNLFDLFVVGVGLLPQTANLTALRGLRVIRALRLLSVIPQMRAVVQALLDALPGMGAVIVMIAIVFYVFGVMATLMYGDTFDEWFGTLGRSLYTLFQVMTLESWSMGIVRPVMEAHPTAWAFFVPFIVLTAFSVLNLFIGLIVNTMQSAVEEEKEAEIEQLRDSMDASIKDLKDELAAIRADLRAIRGQATGGGGSDD